MDVEICRYALDRQPLSLIIDDSTALLNLNYFFLRDRNRARGEQQRWDDLPVVIPERFTREWAEWCAAAGVRGKYSIVPCPAGVGRLDHGLPLFGQRDLDHWLAMCREVIVPSFDITPEMLTHTAVLDLATFLPRPSGIWEQYEWSRFTAVDDVGPYIQTACQILANIGLPPSGVTSPGGFGGKSLELYARLAGEAVRAVTGNPTPFFFQRLYTEETAIDTPVWYADREAGTAVGEVIACTHDFTGSWTGYGEVDADYYLTPDLQHGRLAAVLDAGSSCVLCSHWQGMYGLHDGDRRGFRTLQTVVERLRQRDPHGERTRWRTCSEITNYACARALADLAVTDETITLDLPRTVPELTLRLRGRSANAVSVAGQPLHRVDTRRAFVNGTYLVEGADTLFAFDPPAASRRIEVAVEALRR